MKSVLIVYATREGQTKQIAERLAERLHSLGFAGTLLDAREVRAKPLLTSYNAAVVAASVHSGKHEPEITKFVRQNLAELNYMLTAFVSVSLSQAGVQDGRATEKKRARSAANVKRMLDDFFRETKWQPKLIQPVAGALRYKKSNFVLRALMKRIARETEASTDTSRDHVFTRWEDVDAVANELASRLDSLDLKLRDVEAGTQPAESEQRA